MAKWQRENYQTTDRLVSIWSKHDGSPDLGEGDVADYLNRLETDKAEMVSLIANLLSMAEAAGGEWEWGTDQMQAVNQARQLLARLKS